VLSDHRKQLMWSCLISRERVSVPAAVYAKEDVMIVSQVIRFLVVPSCPSPS
jgi:hypothetical protein